MKIGQTITQSGLITEETFFINNAFQVKISNSELHQLHYIYGPLGLCAIIDKLENQPDKIDYILNDYLGSVQVVLNSDGSLKQEYSYDAWGTNRDPVTLLNFTTFDRGLLTNGYTGHEHLDLFSLIDMKGRIYDPVLGRFLSVDPVMQFPDIAQGINPYSYSFNNPLRFVDPNGYSFVGEFGALVFSSVVTLGTGIPLLGAVVFSIVMTGDQMYESGASLNAAFFCDYIIPSFAFNSFSAICTNNIGSFFSQDKFGKAFAHATFNGTMSLAQGGRFEHGFFSALVPTLLSSSLTNSNAVIKLIVGSLSGGFSSQIGGGKFANGAITGAFVVLFNHILHDEPKPILKSIALAKLIKLDPKYWYAEAAFSSWGGMFIGQEKDYGLMIILEGKDMGEIYIYDTFATGIGDELSISKEEGRIDAFGIDPSNFEAKDVAGEFYKAWIGVFTYEAVFFGMSVNFSFSFNEPFIMSTSFSAGFGGAPFIISTGINHGILKYHGK